MKNCLILLFSYYIIFISINIFLIFEENVQNEKV